MAASGMLVCHSEWDRKAFQHFSCRPTPTYGKSNSYGTVSDFGKRYGPDYDDVPVLKDYLDCVGYRIQWFPLVVSFEQTRMYFRTLDQIY
jgi:hypothetical protein